MIFAQISLVKSAAFLSPLVAIRHIYTLFQKGSAVKLSELFWTSNRAKNPKEPKKIVGLDDAISVNCTLSALVLNIVINIFNYHRIFLKQSVVYSPVLLSSHRYVHQFFDVSWYVRQPAVRRGRRVTCTSRFNWSLIHSLNIQATERLGFDSKQDLWFLLALRKFLHSKSNAIPYLSVWFCSHLHLSVGAGAPFICHWQGAWEPCCCLQLARLQPSGQVRGWRAHFLSQVPSDGLHTPISAAKGCKDVSLCPVGSREFYLQPDQLATASCEDLMSCKAELWWGH